MLRYLSAAIIILLLVPISASAELFRFRAPSAEELNADETRAITIYSSIDIDIARPLIRAFQAANPNTEVAYHDLQTVDLYERILRETDTGETTADIAISSAMDLQMKLANDGYARPWSSSITADLPQWAVWRDEAFGITFEPAVMVFHKPWFKNAPPPKSRSELMTLLRKRQPDLHGRIATYDVERSGLGLLFLARDAQHSEAIWQLVSLFGENGVKLYSNSSAIIDRVAKGKFVLGYNLLGSYAAAKAARDPNLGVALLEDYTVVMSRIALIPKSARSPELGASFLSFILSAKGQEILSSQMHMSALSATITGPNTASALRQQIGSRLRPIRIGPGLLVYLDQVKRRNLLQRWNRALGGR